MLAAASATAVEVHYNAVVSTGGETAVFTSINGLGVTDVPLPLDSSLPQVKNAVAIPSKKGVWVYSDKEAVLAYKSRLHTSSKNGFHYYAMDLANASKISLNLYLPGEAKIMHLRPDTGFSRENDLLKISWGRLNPGQKVIVKYECDLLEPETALRESKSPTSILLDEKLGYTLALSLLITATLLVFARLIDAGKKQGFPTKNEVKVMSNLTGNEKRIVETLLANMGGLTRVMIKKKTGLPGSSISYSLKRLEEKNIVRRDNTGSLQYVELTQWFMNQ